MVTNVCTIKLIDEVKAVIIGLKREEMEFFYDKFGYLSDKYFFNPKYKLGVWDGKIRFFSNNGLTYINLLPDIISYIKQLGYKLQLKDQRPPISFEVPEIDKDYFKHRGIELGDHQVDAINSLLEFNFGVVEAGTGAGKSYMMAALCDLYNKQYKLKTITIVPTIDLVTQTKLEYIKMGLDVGEYSGTVKDINHQHVVSTWQSLINNYAVLGSFQMIIIDEAHLATGKSLQAILNDHGSHFMVRFGLTGTLPKNKANLTTLHVLLGATRYTIEASTLMDLGWLAQLKIKIYQLEENLQKEWEEFRIRNPEEWQKTTYKQFKQEALVDYHSEMAYLNNKKIRNEFILKITESIREEIDSNILILVNNISMGKKLEELIPNSTFVYGKDKKEIRKEIYDSFADNDMVTVISTYKMASTGLNIPRIFNLILIDAGQGFTKVIQSIGRSLRKAHDKDSVNVYDVCSDLKYSKRHLNKRISFYKEKNYNYTKKLIDYE